MIPNQQTLFNALHFANWAHRNQQRKIAKTPYIVHPMHVMTLLMTHGMSLETEAGLTVLISGLLHDTVEDNPNEVTLQMVEDKFGLEVAAIVSMLTLDPKHPDKVADRQKIVQCENWKGQIVKVADILSNTMSTIQSIREHGLNVDPMLLEHKLAERMAMEWKFITDMQTVATRQTVAIIASTIKALEEVDLLRQ